MNAKQAYNQIANDFLLNLQGSFIKVTSFQFLHEPFSFPCDKIIIYFRP